MAIKLSRTREQKENKARNTGTKAMLLFEGKGTLKSKKILLENKETQGKFFWGTREQEPPIEGLRLAFC